MKSTQHPLFTLISQNTETASESPGTTSGTSLADGARVAGGCDGEAGGGGAGAGAVCGGSGGASGGGVAAAATVADPWQVVPGVSVLAILDPPVMDGSQGRVQFDPGLTLAERREIMFDVEWFDVRVRRRQRQSESLSNSTWFANW
jgi:hypothetical protein